MMAMEHGRRESNWKDEDGGTVCHISVIRERNLQKARLIFWRFIEHHHFKKIFAIPIMYLLCYLSHVYAIYVISKSQMLSPKNLLKIIGIETYAQLRESMQSSCTFAMFKIPIDKILKYFFLKHSCEVFCEKHLH